jgi:hypothetical protein
VLDLLGRGRPDGQDRETVDLADPFAQHDDHAGGVRQPCHGEQQRPYLILDPLRRVEGVDRSRSETPCRAALVLPAAVHPYSRSTTEPAYNT